MTIVMRWLLGMFGMRLFRLIQKIQWLNPPRRCRVVMARDHAT